LCDRGTFILQVSKPPQTRGAFCLPFGIGRNRRASRFLGHRVVCCRASNVSRGSKLQYRGTKTRGRLRGPIPDTAPVPARLGVLSGPFGRSVGLRSGNAWLAVARCASKFISIGPRPQIRRARRVPYFFPAFAGGRSRKTWQEITCGIVEQHHFDSMPRYFRADNVEVRKPIHPSGFRDQCTYPLSPHGEPPSSNWWRIFN